MKVGNIVQPNQKGQIVIPKKIRDRLGIGAGSFLNLILKRGAIHLYPIEGVVERGEDNPVSYLQVLKKTKGSWAKGGRFKII